jgi:hypothetical protein
MQRAELLATLSSGTKIIRLRRIASRLLRSACLDHAREAAQALPDKLPLGAAQPARHISGGASHGFPFRNRPQTKKAA